MPKTTLEINGKDTGATRALTDVTGAVAKAALALQGLNVVSSSMLGLASKSIDAYKEQEQALAKLRVNVGSNTKEYEKFASEIQNLTTIGDEQILTIQNLGLNMGISKDKINDATKGAIGLSESLGMDLNTAMRMVSMAGEGNYTMLSRYLPALRNVDSEAEKAAILQELVAKGFDAAKNKAGTLTGALEQNANLWGDVQEEIGKTLLEIGEPFTKALGDVLKWFLALDDGTKDLIATVGIVAGASVTASVAIVGIATSVKAVTVAMAGNPFGAILVGITAIVSAAVVLVRNLTKAKDELAKLSEDELNKKLEKDTEKFTELAKITKISTVDLAQFDKAKKDAMQTIEKYGDTVVVAGLKELDQQRKLAENIIAIKKKLKAQKKDIETQTGKTVEKTAKEYADKLFDLENSKLAVLKKNMAKELKEHEGNEKARYQITKYYGALIEKAKLEETAQGLTIASGYFGAMNTLVSGLYQNEIDAAEEGSEKKKQLQRDAFVANKALAVGNIVLSTAQAIVNALATPPAPLGIALAAVAGVMGAAQLAVAASQPMPSFDKGGVVPGNSYAGDKVLVRANSGEMILTAEQQQQLLSGRGGSMVFSGNINVYPRDVEDFTRQMRNIARLEAARA